MTVESMKHRVSTILAEHELEIENEIKTAVENAVNSSNWRDRLALTAKIEAENLMQSIAQRVVREAFQQSELRERMTKEAEKAARKAFKR